LNDRETDILAMATPKRQYYYKSAAGCRLFELALSPIALAYCGSSTPEDRQTVAEFKRNKGEDFNRQWLQHKKLPMAEEFYQTVSGMLINKEVA
jgi:type IV secretion system protein VirB4